MRAVLIVCSVALVVAQIPVSHFQLDRRADPAVLDNVEFDDISYPAPTGQTQSQNIIYKNWDASAAAGVGFGGVGALTLQAGQNLAANNHPLSINPTDATLPPVLDYGFGDRFLRLRFTSDAAATAAEVRVILADPDIDLLGGVCTGNAMTLTAQAQDVARDGMFVRKFLLPVFNYYEHPPIPGQADGPSTFRRICLAPAPGGVVGAAVDSGVLLAVGQSCTDNMTPAEQAIYDPSAIYRCGTNAPAGQLLQDANGEVFFNNAADVAGANTVGLNLNFAGASNGVAESDPQARARLRRGVCCGDRIRADLNGDDVLEPARFGVCINPSTDNNGGVAGPGTQCCGSRPFNGHTERCCNRLDSQITHADAQCPCTTATTHVVTVGNTNLRRQCNYEGPNVPGNGGNSGRLQGPSSFTRDCCAISKYPEITPIARQGVCFDRALATRESFACCDDGNVYDPASSQCCPINGVQSLNIPCPCHLDSDCGDRNDPTNPQRCCRQLFPPPNPINEGAAQCNAYANFPRGTAPFATQRCYGTCYNSRWQICCNGATCTDSFERCCNNTCCNKFSSSCVEGNRPGAVGSRTNSLNFQVFFEVCSDIENLTVKRAFLVFVMPVMMLFATLLCFAMVIVLARRATEHVFELTERALVFIAAAIVLLSLPFFFSPLYKVGIFLAFVGLIAILAAVVRKKRYSFALIIIVALAVLYLVNPFGGNFYFGFPSGLPAPLLGRTNFAGRPNYFQNGPYVRDTLPEAVVQLIENPTQCTDFYDFFGFDDNVRDFERISNPVVTTYGYCSRTWLVTLLITAILLILLALLLLLLAVFSFAKKLGYKAPEVVQLETVLETDGQYAPGIGAPMPIY